MLYPCTSLSVHADDGGSSSLSVQTHRLASRIDALDGMAAHSAGVCLFSCDGHADRSVVPHHVSYSSAIASKGTPADNVTGSIRTLTFVSPVS